MNDAKKHGNKSVWKLKLYAYDNWGNGFKVTIVCE